MSDETSTPVSDETTKASGALGTDQSQERMDEETDKGYRGVNPDPTPNAHYTVAGVTAGKPTPETDAAQAAKVREHQARQ